MAAAPIFFATPRFGSGLLSTANTGRDGTGSLVSLLTAGASGTRIERLRAKARDTTTAGMVRFFLFNGTATYFLLEEIAVTAITPSGTVKSFEDEVDLTTPGKFTFLPSPWSLLAATHNAEAIFAEAWGSDV